jgi:hypothetical protein
VGGSGGFRREKLLCKKNNNKTSKRGALALRIAREIIREIREVRVIRSLLLTLLLTFAVELS